MHTCFVSFVSICEDFSFRLRFWEWRFVGVLNPGVVFLVEGENRYTRCDIARTVEEIRNDNRVCCRWGKCLYVCGRRHHFVQGIQNLPKNQKTTKITIETESGLRELLSNRAERSVHFVEKRYLGDNNVFS